MARTQCSEVDAETAIHTNRGYVKDYVSNDVMSSLCRSQAQAHFTFTEITKEMHDKSLHSSFNDISFVSDVNTPSDRSGTGSTQPREYN
jgi:hypothetical protein